MELELLLEREPWPQALRLLQHWGALVLFDPALQADQCWQRRIRWAERAGLNRLLAWIAPSADPLALAERLQLPHRQQRLLRAFLQLRCDLAQLDPCEYSAWRPSDWTLWLEHRPLVVEAVALALVCDVVPRRPLLRWWLHWRHVDAGIAAQTLLAGGMRPGPALGERLRQMRRARLDRQDRLPPPLVGVVIPVYNDWSGLQDCLQSLAKQTYPVDRLLVRVVDNGSSDWPSDPAFPLPVEVIHHALPGSYGARNQAARGWSVEVLAFTDADCRPQSDWISQGVSALQAASEPWPLLAGRIRLIAAQPDNPTPAEQLDQILGFDQARTVRRAGFGVTANMMVARTTFEALDGFCSATRSGGDRDFCDRARFAGFSLIYCDRVVVDHPARDWPGLVDKQRRIVGGRLALADRWPWSRLLVLALSLRPLLSESLRVSRQRSLPLKQRFGLLCLVMRLRFAVLQEWLRLQFPGQVPQR